MATQTDRSQPATGRTPWDALVEISNRFAPPILIIAIVAWAFYEYQKSDREHLANLDNMRRESSEAYKNELTRLNEALIKTYQGMQEITDARIEQLQPVLKLGDDIIARIRTAYEEEAEKQRQIEDLNRQKSDLETC